MFMKYKSREEIILIYCCEEVCYAPVNIYQKPNRASVSCEAAQRVGTGK
jgi:hypothetical protein